MIRQVQGLAAMRPAIQPVRQPRRLPTTIVEFYRKSTAMGRPVQSREAQP